MTLDQLYWGIKVTGAIGLNSICSSGGHSKARSLETDFLQMDFLASTGSASVLGIFIDVFLLPFEETEWVLDEKYYITIIDNYFQGNSNVILVLRILWGGSSP